MTNLYLIRHGEAVSNVEPIIGGMRGDTGLTRLGVAQAQRLRDRLAKTGEIKADVLIASTLPRARQTAEIIAPALKLPIRWDEEVQELRTGEADGLSLDAFKEKFGIPDFEREPFRPLAPGGENWGGFMLRAAIALDRIIREHTGKTIVIVCHGGIIDAAFVYFFRLNSVMLPPIELSTRNTAITHWQQEPRDDRPLRWRLKYYNDAAHLRDLDSGTPLTWEDAASKPSVPLPTEQPKDA